MANSGGGFFSNQWIGIDYVISSIEALNFNDLFKAIIFIPLYQSSSLNNYGFLAVALRAEGILDAIEDQSLSHVMGTMKACKTATNKLIGKVDLHDDVVETEAIKQPKRAEIMERMKSVSFPSRHKLSANTNQ